MVTQHVEHDTSVVHNEEAGILPLIEPTSLIKVVTCLYIFWNFVEEKWKNWWRSRWNGGDYCERIWEGLRRNERILQDWKKLKELLGESFSFRNWGLFWQREPERSL